MECERLDEEPENGVFLTWILSEKSPADTCTAATTSQKLSKAFQKNTAVNKNSLPLSKVLNLCL